MLEIDENDPPMAPTAGNRARLARLDDVNRDLGCRRWANWTRRAVATAKAPTSI